MCALLFESGVIRVSESVHPPKPRHYFKDTSVVARLPTEMCSESIYDIIQELRAPVVALCGDTQFFDLTLHGTQSLNNKSMIT